MMDERPRRIRIRLPGWIRLGSRELAGSTVNLSEGGTALKLRTRPPVTLQSGTRVGMRLLLPDGTEASGTAEIAWPTTDPDVPPALGLRFVELPGETAARIARLCREFRPAVAVLDPNSDHDELYRALEGDFRILRCADPGAALALLEAQEVAAFVVSEALAQLSGYDLLERIDARLPNAPFARIVLSEGTVAAPLRGMISRGKLFGFLRAPLTLGALDSMLRRAIDWYSLAVENERLTGELERVNRRLTEENAYLRQRVVGIAGFERMVGRSPQLLETLRQLERIRRTDATVHLSGETGTGKELAARALHEGGPRRDRPFVAQNCAGLTEELAQSTLFGHRRGAFTGAIADRAGVFEQASGGTLFLDEVAELSLPMQAMLLRALQQGEITPVGASRPVQVDVRVISATHVDLRAAIAEGRFREDLFYRLLVVKVRLPALREREGDVPLLATHFLDLHCERKRKNVRGFSPASMRALERYAWPGNVRELENEIERLVVLLEDGVKVPLAALSERIRGASEPVSALEGLRIAASGYDAALEELQRTLIERALAESGGVINAAAQQLGMERSRLSKLRGRLLGDDRGGTVG
jgi:DNA-binding NtrC family response regulator